MTTPKPIDSLTPEELRVEIAEAMGWKCLKCGKHPIDGAQRWKSVSPDGQELSSGYDRNEIFRFHLPNYPADANAALTLADALGKQGWRCEAYILKTGWHIMFDKLPARHPKTADTFPLALSRAYLAVIRSTTNAQ